ncbi:MarR family EPS-associated transcriptional regulator [Paracandidimonas soli]|uniref:EPS-associated MarR family transcriptional regulator n=1 Tax=Paracandidimonas soli TaxID=1917182 RepID=A0A4R3V7G7_9BURK|nr:MarR family EPS-associated transcriptional regulator [Paracandidimonas soli]TCU98304.1 EPS-associated MarR family transcriptional regulator [Paracandidimonas soli]
MSSLYEESHLKVLRLLESNPQLSQRELAEALGVSVGKVNYCLNALIDKGLVKIQNFRNNKNKRVYAYLLTPKGIAEKAEMTVQFLQRKMVEYELLREEIERLRLEIDDPNTIIENN